MKRAWKYDKRTGEVYLELRGDLDELVGMATYPGPRASVDAAVRWHIRQALFAAGGVFKVAGRTLKCSLTFLYDKGFTATKFKSLCS